MKLRPLLVFSSLLAMFTTAASAASLKVGDDAPNVTAVTETGATLALADVYAKQPYTLVYFYPKAGTPGCTKQGCALRDANDELAKKGVAIIGVSTDDVAAQKAFKEKNHFPFTLLADTDKQVIKAFGQSALMFASREAYLIKDGKIVYKDAGVTAKQGENILAYLNTQKS
jgi:peroxiredoxin Q/BCP